MLALVAMFVKADAGKALLMDALLPIKQVQRDMQRKPSWYSAV